MPRVGHAVQFDDVGECCRAGATRISHVADVRVAIIFEGKHAVVGGRIGIEFLLDQLDRRQHARRRLDRVVERSEEHTSELQSLMRISYAVFCLKKKKKQINKALKVL